MPIEITMPKLTDTMTEATLAKWLKKEGDSVKPGDMIAEVETDKATQELETFEAGTIAKILIPEGGKTPVGALICVIAKPGEDVKQVAANVKGLPLPAPKQSQTPPPKPTKPNPDQPAGAAQPPVSNIPVEDHQEGQEPEVLHTGKRRVSPLARKIANEKGIDVATIRGSGPDGRIIKRDILEAADRPAAASAPRAMETQVKSSAPRDGNAAPAGAPAAAPPAPKLEHKNIPLSNMRQTIARRLVQSKQTIPHFYISIDVVMDKLLALRSQVNEQIAGGEGGPAGSEKLSVTDFIARAAALALTRVPTMNSSFAETTIIQHGSVDLGIAVALEDGLVVPVVKSAHAKSVRQLSAEIKNLAELARTKKLKAEQMTGSTFTISNLGMYGIKDFSAIINPPESAILAVGGTSWQPIVKESKTGGGGREIVPAQVMNLTLSADHRAVDGATAAKFLQQLKTLLEAPLTLLL